MFALAALTLTLETLQVPIAQGAPDVGFKRKADDDNQIYDWQTDERAYDVQVKQWQRNNDVRTKILAGAEAAVVKTKGVAEAVVVKAKGVAESKVIAAGADIKKADAHAIRLGADGKKRRDDAEAKKIEADAEKTKAEAMLLQFELEQKKNAAGNAPVVPVAMLKKSNSVAPANAPVVLLAINKKSNKTKQLTEEQKLNKRNKEQQVRRDAKAYREGLGSA